MEPARQRILADQSAHAQLQVALAREVVDVSRGQLADAEYLVLARVSGKKELVLVGALRAREKGVRLAEGNGRFQKPGIGPIAVAVRVAAPRQGGLPFRRSKVAVVDHRRRRAVDVVVRMELLWTLDVSAAHLQRPAFRRIV